MTGSTRRDVGAAGLKVCRIGTGVGIGGGRGPELGVSLSLISFFGGSEEDAEERWFRVEWRVGRGSVWILRQKSEETDAEVELIE